VLLFPWFFRQKQWRRFFHQHIWSPWRCPLNNVRVSVSLPQRRVRTAIVDTCHFPAGEKTGATFFWPKSTMPNIKMSKFMLYVDFNMSKSVITQPDLI
jgi:hypothetical protein